MLVARWIMGAAYKAAPSWRQQFRWRTASDHRIPRRRNDPVAVAILHHIAKPGERIVEALPLQLLGDDHVIDAPAGLLRHFTILVEVRVPGGIGREQMRIIGHVRLDEHLART